MHAVILAAGEGNRMGAYTDDKPKTFLDVDGRTLYERQLDVLDDHVDDVTIVLGYRYDNVIDDVGSADAVVFEDWSEYENAESLRRALETVDDDVVVLNGDVIVARSVVDRLVRAYDTLDGEYSLVGCLPGSQSEHTAIRYDDENVVTDYGMITGHRHAGLGLIDRNHLPRARSVLERNANEWYPVIYPELETKRVVVPERQHVEINRPSDLERARDRLPLDVAVAAESRGSVEADGTESRDRRSR